jgi:hypothetical protein
MFTWLLKPKPVVYTNIGPHRVKADWSFRSDEHGEAFIVAAPDEETARKLVHDHELSRQDWNVHDASLWLNPNHIKCTRIECKEPKIILSSITPWDNQCGGSIRTYLEGTR